MSKELFVTSTPHETKVGLVEDDQLAEIYLERENEYTLAGSIYKGRVTRVLPGMQSAFVDIGLERDAFLYVSDFMELEEQEDDLNDVVPTNRPAVSESRPQPARSEAPATVAEPGTGEGPARERGGFRNRRRRRGRRFEDDRGNRSERRFHRSSESASPSEPQSRFRGRDDEYGPPPGYQPIILPGESISKYRGRASQPPVAASGSPVQTSPEASPANVASSFPEDEPLFAAGLAEPLHEQHGDGDHPDEAAHQEWEREHALQDRMHLTAAFAGEPVREDISAVEKEA